MYTRCPGCSSTFRVTAPVLQMAEGDVRCGSCGTVFNALRTLVDDWDESAHTLPPTPAPPIDPVEQEPAGENLEFDAPEHDWQRFFIAAEEPALTRRPEPALGSDFEADAATPVAAGDAGAGTEAPEPARSLEEETADTDTWKTFLQEADSAAATDTEADESPLWLIRTDDDAGGAAEPLVRATDIAEPEHLPVFELQEEPDELRDADRLPADTASAAMQPAATEAAIADGPLAAGATAEPARPDTILEWGPPPAFTQAPAPRHTARWLAASVVAALVLAGQVLHQNRDQLAAHPQYGDMVRALYARLGQAIYPDWPLDTYQIRGVKAIAGNSAPGALDIVAEIAITGKRPVGLPLVRVVLRDRWTNPVGSGVFRAAEYLAGPASASGIYAPGALIPVELSLPDPGTTAQGYEVDVCLPNRRLGLQCKTARDPYRH